MCVHNSTIFLRFSLRDVNDFRSNRIAGRRSSSECVITVGPRKRESRPALCISSHGRFSAGVRSNLSLSECSSFMFAMLNEWLCCLIIDHLRYFYID